ncbi:MAG: D-alanyl-D-alanine carboxypeptidase [Clostridia bacterium]|nr:D-alanyl-D-alanine carboxypeptidase [Clostridia bacterium]
MRFLRIISIILSFTVVALYFPFYAYALSDEEITAPSAVLMDAETGEILYEKNPHEVRACASITKVMTLDLVMEAIDGGKISLDDTVTASAHAASMGGSDIWLEQGETMTVDEMIKATVVASANDAAVALAEYICGTEDEFVTQMNKKAQQLGMKETVFKNCNGLDEDGHVTSAYDVALMSKDLIKHKKIFEYSGIWIDYLRGGKTQLVNTNKLLKTYNGITGLKTGTTSQAGSCISATAERDGLSLIAVVLGSATGKERFSDAAKLLDYGFANYAMYVPAVPENAVCDIKVKNGMKPTVRTTADVSKPFLIAKGSDSKITAEVSLKDEVDAPVKKGDKLGKIIYKNDKDKIAEYPITAANSVEQISFWSVFSILFRTLISL